MARSILPLLLACSAALVGSALPHLPTSSDQWQRSVTELSNRVLPQFRALPAEDGAFAPGECTNRCTLLIAGVTPTYLKAPVWPYPAAPEDYRGLTDTIVMVHLEAGAAPQMLSIPRDTWTRRPGFRDGRINEANRLGGAALLAESAEHLTGVRPDHVILLNMHGVRDIVDAMGGVEIDIKEAMSYHDQAGNLHIELQPGRQRLTGAQAEGFLRWRGDGRGDIGRAERQQAFVRAAAQGLANPREWWRAGAIKSAIEARSSTSLQPRDMMALIGLAARVGPRLAAPVTRTLPGAGGVIGEWVPDLDAARALGQAWTQAAPALEVRAQTHVRVYNAGAPTGSARAVAAELSDLGYASVTADNAQTPGHSALVAPPAASSQLSSDLRTIGVQATWQDNPAGQAPAQGAQSGASPLPAEGEDNPSGAPATYAELYLGQDAALALRR